MNNIYYCRSCWSLQNMPKKQLLYLIREVDKVTRQFANIIHIPLKFLLYDKVLSLTLFSVPALFMFYSKKFFHLVFLFYIITVLCVTLISSHFVCHDAVTFNWKQRFTTISLAYLLCWFCSFKGIHIFGQKYCHFNLEWLHSIIALLTWILFSHYLQRSLQWIVSNTVQYNGSQ